MLYLCDTCILIDYLRGNEVIRQKLSIDRKQCLGMSAVTYMELMVGALNKQEINIIKKTFADFKIIEISDAVSSLARSLVEEYSKSHGLLIPDALIAATAIEYDTPLWTANKKDFRFIPDIQIM